VSGNQCYHTGSRSRTAMNPESSTPHAYSMGGLGGCNPSVMAVSDSYGSANSCSLGKCRCWCSCQRLLVSYNDDFSHRRGDHGWRRVNKVYLVVPCGASSSPSVDWWHSYVHIRRGVSFCQSVDKGGVMATARFRFALRSRLDRHLNTLMSLLPFENESEFNRVC
jgi:hypothetical protein